MLETAHDLGELGFVELCGAIDSSRDNANDIWSFTLESPTTVNYTVTSCDCISSNSINVGRPVVSFMQDVNGDGILQDGDESAYRSTSLLLERGAGAFQLSTGNWFLSLRGVDSLHNYTVALTPQPAGGPSPENDPGNTLFSDAYPIEAEITEHVGDLDPIDWYRVEVTEPNVNLSFLDYRGDEATLIWAQDTIPNDIFDAGSEEIERQRVGSKGDSFNFSLDPGTYFLGVRKDQDDNEGAIYTMRLTQSKR